VSPTEPGRDGAAGTAGLAGTGVLDAELEDYELADPQLAGRQRAGNRHGDRAVAQGGDVDGGLASSPAPSRQEKEEQQRHLRLVQNQARRRAGRRRLLVTLGIASVAIVGLALVALHVLIAENQFRLDGLQQQAATEQAGYEKLRLQVAELEAPARIVSVAEGRLGMVQPASVTYLPATTSSPPVTSARHPHGAKASDGRASQARQAAGGAPVAADPPTTSVVTAPQGDSDWPSVKPYLSGSP
jgi:cell division protein FtsL